MKTNAIAHVGFGKFIVSQSRKKGKAHNMICNDCQTEARKHGKDRKGNQRYYCGSCSKTFIEPREKPLKDMRLPMERALFVLTLLAEGNSIRSTERITRVHRDTILDLLVIVGERCERFLEDRIQGVSVRDVQCDEIWTFVSMKEKTKKKRGHFGEGSDQLGDAYTFVGFERNTKLVLAWHLGRRTFDHTWEFTKKLAQATANHNLLLRNDVNKATGEVALLQKEAANARAAQQRVETELAKQQERAANAEKSLAELQERIRPRGLTGVQQALLIEFLQNNIKGSIDITCPLGNAEALAFASQIDTVLRSAGWMTSGVSQAVYTPDNPIGIDLAVRNARSAPPFAIVLQQAFKLIGLPVDGTERSDIPEGKVLLTVGVKP